MDDISESNKQEQGQLTAETAALVHEARAMRGALEQLRQHRLLTTYDSTPRLLSLMFLKGIAFGLGSVVGATIVVSILVYLLGQIEFIPIVGEWVRAILDTLNQ